MMTRAAHAVRVSFDDEPLILVDERDEVIGHMPKADCHAGDGVLHRAFSVFLFDPEDRLLVQQRSAEKPLWPLVWSNSCCSHPRRGESMEEAVSRRLAEELGVVTEPVFLFKFRYHARYRDVGSEHEMCSVFAARSRGPLHVNPTEIADWTYLEPAEVDHRLAGDAGAYSPWFKLEWPRIRRQHWRAVASLPR